VKRLAAFVIAVMVTVSFTGCSGIQERINEKRYAKASGLISEGDYAQAYKEYTRLGDYLDSESLAAECQNWIAYNDAKKLMDANDYEGASAAFSSLGDFENAASLAEECENWLKIKSAGELVESGRQQDAYELIKNIDGEYAGLDDIKAQCCKVILMKEAQDYYDAGDYLGALRTLSALSTADYDRSDYEVAYELAYSNCQGSEDQELLALSEDCYKELKYADAMSYYASGNWSSAASAFSALGDFKDAAEMAAGSEKKVAEEEAAAEAARQAEWQSSYATALSYYNSGRYYSAYVAFSGLGDYSDSRAMASACRQSMPANGSMKSSSGSDCELTIYAPSGSDYVYVKVYTSGGAFAGSVFLAPDGSSTIGLSGGSYLIKAAYGTAWWGSTEMFGDDGYYSLLTDQSGSTIFSLDYGYGYSLELSVSSGGNVGSRSVGRSGF